MFTKLLKYLNNYVIKVTVLLHRNKNKFGSCLKVTVLSDGRNKTLYHLC